MHFHNIAIEHLIRLLEIDGPSGDEREVVNYLTQVITPSLGSSAKLLMDNAHQGFGGSVGNLIVRLEGDNSSPRRMFVAHMDTVPLCLGSKPVLDGNSIRADDPKKGLGADNRTGVAVILSTLEQIGKVQRNNRPPCTFLFTVGEEIGMQGVKNADLEALGGPEYGINFDGGSPHKITYGASGKELFKIYIKGRESHSGCNRENGVDAIHVGALLIHAFRAGQTANGVTTNFGTIKGGSACNIVPGECIIKGEIRGRDVKTRNVEARRLKVTADEIVKHLARSRGRAKVSIKISQVYESFTLEKTSIPVQSAATAIRSTNYEPEYAITTGGIDANWLNRLSIPTASIGSGQRNFHSTHETVDLSWFKQACQIGLAIAKHKN